MEVEKIITKTETKELDISGATLLSIEEYKKYKDMIPECHGNWWLRSPGYGSSNAAVVFGDGTGSYYGRYVNIDDFAIRPALKISNLVDVRVGDIVKFDGKTFTVISPKYALCDTAIGHGAFRKERNAADANVYEASDVKKFVDEWFEKHITKTFEEEGQEEIER